MSEEDTKHDELEEPSKLFDEESTPVMIVNTSGFGPPKPPLTAKDVAWKLLWAFVFFVLVVVLSALLITWLWNENLATATGLPEIELRTTASVVIIFRLASFIWRM